MEPLGHVADGSSAHGGLWSYPQCIEGPGLHEGLGASQGRLGPETPGLGNLGCPQDWLSCEKWAGSPRSSFCGPKAAETPRTLLLEGDKCHPQAGLRVVQGLALELGAARAAWRPLVVGWEQGPGLAALPSHLHT